MPSVTVSSSPYTLAAGQSLSATNDDAILFQSSLNEPPSITIGGSIVVGAETSFRPWTLNGIKVGDNGFYKTSLTIHSGASIRVDAGGSHADAIGLSGGAWMPQVITAGTIQVSATANAYGIYAGMTYARGDIAVANTGAIRATSSEGLAHGVHMGAADGFRNTGSVEAGGLHASVGVYFYQWDASFTNLGVIRASDASPGEDSIGVYANSTFVGPWVNSGLIQGDYSLKFIDYNGPIPSFPERLAPTVFDNSGTMIGKVDLGYLRQVLNNSGSIQGEVNLGSGDDTYAGASGSVGGMVSGGDGNDSLAGGAGFDNFQGNAGADTEFGGDGGDWVVGGKDNDVLSGDAGNDIVYGNIGEDTCDGGSGVDIVRGGQDNDVIRGGSGDDYLSGDKGADTVSGGEGADTFHSFGEAGVDRVVDFNRAEGDRVLLDAGTPYTVTQSGSDIVISMNGGGQMILVGVSMSSLTGIWIGVG